MRAKRWPFNLTDASLDDILRILGMAVSVGRRDGLGMAGPYAAMYETRRAHAPRMRSPFRSTSVCAWSVCDVVCIRYVFQECVSF